MTRRYVCIVTGRNTRAHLERCLASLSCQLWPNYTAVVVDDASTDGSAELAEEVCEREGWTFIGRTERVGALRNQIDAIRASGDDPDDVLVWVDGDDRLAGPDTFQILDRHYEAGALVTWGSYEPDPPSATCPPARPYPPKVVRRNAYREYARPRQQGGQGGGICHNHLRSMARSVFNQIGESDFRDDRGELFASTPDAVVFFPALELARGAVAFVPDVLLYYTSDLPQAEWRDHPRTVDYVNTVVMGRSPKVARW